MRTPETHSVAVEIREHKSDSRDSTLIGLQLFNSWNEAERYVESNEAGGGVWCNIRKARKDDKEFA